MSPSPPPPRRPDGVSGATSRFWRRLQGTPDPLLLEAGEGGERLVARVRVYLALTLLAVQVLPMWGGRFQPLVLVASGLAVAYACWVRWMERRGSGGWLAYFSAVGDVSLVTLTLLALALSGQPHLALNNDVVFLVYFLVQAAASLRFDWRVSLLTAALAVGQYATLVLAVVALHDLDAPGYAPFEHGRYHPAVQVARLALLAAGGTLGCLSVLRARQLKKHLTTALTTAARQERERQVALLEERARLARDLHDSVAQRLFSVTLVAQALGPAWRRDPREGERKVERLLELTRGALVEMRALIAELRPQEPVLELQGAEDALLGMQRLRKEGLAGALRRHGRERSHGELWVDVDDEHYRRQPLELEEVLYRIGQEALDNVVAHASARYASIVLEVRDSGVVLSVQDDGCGFDPERVLGRDWEALAAAEGLGLIGMRERATGLRGMLRVTSTPGQGTRVRVVVPAAGAPSPAA